MQTFEFLYETALHISGCYEMPGLRLMDNEVRERERERERLYLMVSAEQNFAVRMNFLDM